jgi:transcription termination/antitermination protein NusG
MNEHEPEPTPDEAHEDLTEDTSAEPPIPRQDSEEESPETVEAEAADDSIEEASEDSEDQAADEEDVEAEPVQEEAPVAETVPAEPPSKMNWYIVKVTSGREESIKAAIERRVKIEGLEEFFGQVYIPVERIVEVKKVRETKNGEKITKERRVTKERKKFPGYIMAEVEFNDRILYLFRETSGVGDFVGGAGPLKPPPPMTEIEVRRMRGEDVPEEAGAAGKKLKVKLDFEVGDKVRVREGAFANMEGEIKEITDPKETGETPKVTVEVVVIGRPLPVTLDYWQVDKV